MQPSSPAGSSSDGHHGTATLWDSNVTGQHHGTASGAKAIWQQHLAPEHLEQLSGSKNPREDSVLRHTGAGRKTTTHLLALFFPSQPRGRVTSCPCGWTPAAPKSPCPKSAVVSLRGGRGAVRWPPCCLLNVRKG